jgi:hypothetical protein
VEKEEGKITTNLKIEGIKMAKKKMDNLELTLKEKLMMVSHEKLADILISLHESNNEIQKQLDIIFLLLKLCWSF